MRENPSRPSYQSLKVENSASYLDKYMFKNPLGLFKMFQLKKKVSRYVNIFIVTKKLLLLSVLFNIQRSN